VDVCGVCGSDYRYYQGENPWAQHTKGVHMENPPNIVLGHEYAGIVVGVLSERNRKWLGKRVVPICSKVCGKCVYCTTGRAHLCENTIHVGHGQGWGKLSYYPGAYAEYAPAWAEGCFEIPPKISFAEAAMMDVLAVSNHAFHRARHQPDSPILISGCGPIGNGIAQVAKNSGLKDENIIILEKSEVALKVAKKCQLQNIINTKGKGVKEVVELILQRTKNKKVFSVFDSIGTDLSIEIGLSVLDKGGTLVNLAVHNQVFKDLNQMQLSGERMITTSSNFSLQAYQQAWGWLQEKKFILDPWFTRIRLEEVPTIFQKRVENKKAKEFFKLVIEPGKLE
ncbi:MAG: zinc-dependent alcohol dehydrogenase, partial [Candidatus Helarchaeota archaeon]